MELCEEPMRRLFLMGLMVTMITVSIPAQETRAEEETKIDSLYAQSAVLMDGETGRILYEKNGYETKPMASTTKIMTCIIALENGNLEDVITVSAYAASRPKVHLGMRSGEQFYLKDLLYSLMLESHNDSAVAIAEQIGGSVETFAGLMNEKAKKIGCEHTYFITPNGLDASDERGIHGTTAAELAYIMRYCMMESPKKEEFLKITGTKEYSFQDVSGERNFSCNNHNAFLGMMEGAVSGKTGFTGDAGYCYVGALRRDGKTLIVALLACGWPNNRNDKWKDTQKLMTYGLENYHYREVLETDKKFTPVEVEQGIPQNKKPGSPAKASVGYKKEDKEQKQKVLLHTNERVTIQYQIPKKLKAPIEKGEKIGIARYFLEGETIKEYPIVSYVTIGKRTFFWCAKKIAEQYVTLK
ncbi:MAG: D-alanyl-D-alanine carboxypeptidase family protein [Lachnospiraceae bacterium]